MSTSTINRYAGREQVATGSFAVYPPLQTLRCLRCGDDVQLEDVNNHINCRPVNRKRSLDILQIILG